MLSRTRWLLAVAILAGLSSATQAADPASVEIHVDFPGGNIQVERIEGDRVHLAPDLRGDNPWFYWYFEATAAKPTRVQFVFPEKVAGFKNGAIGFQGPAVSRDEGQTWQWMGRETVEENTFSYEFTKAGETVRFAVTIPYVQTDLAKFLERNRDNRHLKKSVLTKSRKGREVELLQIGEPAESREPVLIT